MLRSFILLSVILLAYSSQYDEQMGKEGWYLSSVSYCRQSKVTSWSCGTGCQKAPRIDDITFLYNSTGDSAGFAGYNAARNQIVLVFRGTVPWLIKNWIADLNLFLVTYSDCDGCKVHQGFWNAYIQIQAQVNQVTRSLRQKYPKAGIFVTGHSLGGALATHAMVDLLKQGYQIQEFYTYGSPRVGDVYFSNYFKNLYPQFKSRVTHSHDPVPHLLLQALGYNHINTEIYYHQDYVFWTSYDVCLDNYAEDSKCSNANIADLNIIDHVWYYDLNQLIETPLCQ